MFALKTVVVALDFSDTSEEAGRVGAELAALSGAQLHLLHVTPDPLRQAWMIEAAGVDFAALQQEWARDAARRLSEIASRVPLDAGRVTTAVVSGVAHREILRYADEHDADLIVLGTHGHGPVMQFLLGSVADRIVRQATCPVLTVPARVVRNGDAARSAAAVATA